ncbi:haloacid dehalogenase type II [Streptomyces iconiensis]|uniref:Haloacid dehalogenase type II n=1 Tax=Streptomyces iconiensis TaxID=1384038 RepID=A0ABT7A0G6_9ACTN|nr:haloacid dehalogenase type II [Streptomyces iconiensis]MDJ1134823.1 haloacid dehalogenase type II [Streptomyces iconiensis]
MPEVHDIEAVVFDVLGTMVDEPGGLRAAISEAVSASAERSDERSDDGPDDGPADATVDHLLTVWQEHVEHEQQRIAKGSRAYASTEVIDREAAHRVAGRAGLTDGPAIERLATASQRLAPWHDTLAGLARLARHFPVLGLSHAGRATLLRLNAHAGLRWHQALSAEDARAYKPAPEVYRLAIDAAGCAPERVLMVAAHAWDLRGAQAVGMRTAYVRRPGGDPPKSGDTFGLHAEGLDELVTALTAVQ